MTYLDRARWMTGTRPSTYEECRAAAQAHSVSLAEVYSTALTAWRATSSWLCQFQGTASSVIVEPLDLNFQAVLNAFALFVLVLNLDLKDEIMWQI